MYLMASFVLSFFPRDVLDEIWDLIASVSEGFSTYSLIQEHFEEKKRIFIIFVAVQHYAYQSARTFFSDVPITR